MSLQSKRNVLFALHGLIVKPAQRLYNDLNVYNEKVSLMKRERIPSMIKF